MTPDVFLCLKKLIKKWKTCQRYVRTSKCIRLRISSPNTITRNSFASLKIKRLHIHVYAWGSFGEERKNSGPQTWCSSWSRWAKLCDISLSGWHTPRQAQWLLACAWFPPLVQWYVCPWVFNHYFKIWSRYFSFLKKKNVIICVCIFPLSPRENSVLWKRTSR